MSMKTDRKPQGRVAENKSDVIKRIPAACRDEAVAVAFMEEERWGDYPTCAHCHSERVYQMRDLKTGLRSKRYLWRCRDCKRQYTVRIGTVYEDSRIPLKYWVHAFWRAAASKKGVSALQVSRETGLSYKSALFLMHRIRWAMTGSMGTEPLSGIVEVDETYVGGKQPGAYKKKLKSNKIPVVAMLERGGRVRALPVKRVTGAALRQAIGEHVDFKSKLMTDELNIYRRIGRPFAGGHGRVNHKRGIYVRSGGVTTNSVEGFFALLKRGIMGTFHSVSPKHLHRYVTEFEFRYNHRNVDDGARTRAAIRSADGKRLMYREPKEAAK
jgi:transposase-like protein